MEELIKKHKEGIPLLPTEIEALYPKYIVDAWWKVKTYARHVPNGGGSSLGDVQTLDQQPDAMLKELEAAMDILRNAGLLRERLFKPRPKEYRRGDGNFVVLDLTAEHAISLL